MDDKYFVTKETAGKMKETLGKFILDFEKVNGYPCYGDNFLKAINEGLNNGINMKPFLKLDSYNGQIFDVLHAKTYIQAVKDGNEDIAKNVSTYVEIDDYGHYDFEPLFSWEYLELVNKMREIAKTLGEPGKFDVLLSTDEKGLPAYTEDHIKELYSLVKETNNINIDVLLERGIDGKCLYDNMDMKYLASVVKEGDMHSIEIAREAVLDEMERQKRQMDKYFINEETAKKMKESFKNLNIELEKEGYYNRFDDKLVEKINEGLDNKIDMSPFLKLNIDNTVILSGEHAEAYIRAVKREDKYTAKNVTTILKVENILEEDYGHFRPLFDYDYMKLANDIDNNLTKKPNLYYWELDGKSIADKIFFTNEFGSPVYNINHIKKIHSLIEETLTDEDKSIYYLPDINHVLMETGRYGKCLYNDAQTEYIAAAIKEFMPVELLEAVRMTIEDSNHDTSYGSADMNKVTKKMETIFLEMHELGDEWRSKINLDEMIAYEIGPFDDYMIELYRELYGKDRIMHNLELGEKIDKICDYMHEQLEQKRNMERGEEL